jgi:hypothetical protein
MNNNFFIRNFDYGSILPILLYLLGVYINYLILIENFETAFFLMMIGFVIYVLNNIYINIMGFSTLFNEYLEDIGSFMTFGLSTILFGIFFYNTDNFILFFIFFYASATVLSFARSWVLGFKNSIGWPLALNGIFFPLIYYIYRFYLEGPGESIFLFFYVIVSILMVSEINFLGYNEGSREKLKDIDKRILKQKIGKKKYEEIEIKTNYNNEDNKYKEKENILDLNNKKENKFDENELKYNKIIEDLNKEELEFEENNEFKKENDDFNFNLENIEIDEDYEIDEENLKL